MKFLTVVGARPQFIKAAPLAQAFLEAGHEEVLVHTGQHYDSEMSQVFFDELGIPAPSYNLEVGSGSHGVQTGRMLEGIERLIMDERPDIVVVFGDTNSTIAGALAAAKLQVPIAHVEAGLRSGDRRMPEEINRILTDHCSDILLCTADDAKETLAREGIREGVHVVGDLMVDAFHAFAGTGKPDLPFDGSYCMLTMHRPANTDDPGRIKRILDALEQSERTYLWPVHPRTRRVLKEMGLWDGLTTRGIHAIAPTSYVQTQRILAGADILLTDSGGMQKEAYLAGIPCITLRDTTEWSGTIDTGWNVLVDADPKRILEAINGHHPSGERPDLWGPPGAAQRIIAILEL